MQRTKTSLRIFYFALKTNKYCVIIFISRYIKETSIMDISKIDKNFDIGKNIPVDDAVWYNVAEEPFTLYGGFYDEKGCLYC